MKQPITPSPRHVDVLPQESNLASIETHYPVGHYIPTEDWNRLSKALGINLHTASDLINRVEAMTSIRVNGVDITLEPALLHRLKSRALKQDLNDFLKVEIVRELHNFVGM